MMIIEANNSFDERKVWVVPAAQDNGTFPKTQRRKFHQDWPKEFHVSPFNSTHGFYSISTLDSFPPGGFLGAADTIDITVTLLSSQRRPKLVARVWSVSKPLIPSKISGLYGYFFLASWSLTGPLICECFLVSLDFAWTQLTATWYRATDTFSGFSPISET